MDEETAIQRLRDIIKEANKDVEQEGDIQRMVLRVCRRVKRNDDLYTALNGFLLKRTVEEELNDIRHKDNQRLYRYSPNPTTRGPEAIQSIESSFEESFLLCSMRNGQRLKDCQTADLIEWANSDDARGTKLLYQSTFFRQIASRLRGDELVSTRWVEDELHKLWDKIQRGRKGKSA